MTSDDALSRVCSLPEVVAFTTRVERLSNRSAHGMIMQEGVSTTSWEFYVGEDHDDHLVQWNHFRVEKSSGQISVWDSISKDWVPLVQMRQTASGQQQLQG